MSDLLILIVAVILMLLLFKFTPPHYKPSKDNNTEVSNATSVKKQNVANENVSGEEEGELIAVITAAVAAAMGTSTSHVFIRNVKRVVPVVSPWTTAGRREQMKPLNRNKKTWRINEGINL
ncbi:MULTISPECIES: OadG family transporter subunit [Clostridium]|jgi:Na+-transporting methylmalonyl-CoA/oxaloacetate decarboxylase gamma subunit|uniref:OadG family transporter subunit n=1 Tax=Clostridium lapidicellarium TaxID=3240931 RepID=A0ABV4DZV8_9CLOT|nr:OadG family transporter subunit [uncultured Clostridium sp.]NLU08430.1 hypothetical protein [Clostridiales bacterium]